MVVANLINLGANIGGMGAAMSLLSGGHAGIYATVLAVVSLVLQFLLPYSRYVNILKWLTIALFAYVATVFAVHIPWGAALHSTVLPPIHSSKDYLTGLIAVLGTTISPYLFFWQTSEEAEGEEDAPSERPLKQAPEQAAAALRPVAGKFASLLFSAGIVGTGLLAIPVLPGSAAYAIGEAMGWRVGLNRKPYEAKAFYAVLAVSTGIGLGMTFLHFDPIKALFWGAVINGAMAGPLMNVIMVMTSNRKVMGKFTLPPGLRIMGWLATIAMLLAAVGLIFAQG